MGDRTEINPSAECLDRWQEGDLHLGGQGRSLLFPFTFSFLVKHESPWFCNYLVPI